MEKPNLYSYDDFRKYLQDWFAWMKEAKPGFSFRAFSRWAGFKSPNQLLLVMNGQRNIALTSLKKYFDVLKLNQTEKKYFELLVKFNQAKDMPTKTELFRDLSSYWLTKGQTLREEQLKYLSNWYYIAIREMVNLKDFKEDPFWIAKKLGGLISVAQARVAIADLLELDLLKRGADKELIQTSNYVTTGDEASSVSAFLYHQQMMQLAMDSLKNKPSHERNLTALTFTMGKRDYHSLVSEINEFRKKIIALLQNRKITDADDDLYQLSMYLFPIGKPGA